MARPRKNPLPTPAETTPVPEVTVQPEEKKTRRIGRKRKLEEEPVNETRVLIDVVLRNRGNLGATPDVLHNVVSWARAIREEGETLSGLSEHPRRQKAEISTERIARYEMNRALLDGVLSGTIALNVQENGELVFHYASLALEPATMGTTPSTNGIAPETTDEE